MSPAHKKPPQNIRLKRIRLNRYKATMFDVLSSVADTFVNPYAGPPDQEEWELARREVATFLFNKALQLVPPEDQRQEA